MAPLPPTVLVAEDEHSLIETLSRAIGRAGCVCDVAEDGEVAIRLLTQRRYDLLWLDQCMPKASGTAVLETARSLGLRTPAILCSGHATYGDQRRASDLGTVLYVPKPFSMEDVPDIVRAAIAADDSLVRRAIREVLALHPSATDSRDACLGILLRLMLTHIDLSRCAVIADAIRRIAAKEVSPIEHARRTLASVADAPAPSRLTALLTLVDTLKMDDAGDLARAAGIPEPDVRRALHTAPGIDIRHWVRLSRVRWTLRFMRQGMKVYAAGDDAGFPGGGSQVTRDFVATISLHPHECAGLLQL